MLRSIWAATTGALQRQQQRLFFWPHLYPPPQLELAWAGVAAPQLEPASSSSLLNDLAVWFAVPKKRRTRHKIRLRTTVQNRIKLRQDIVTDPRTGELTLRHRLPHNWFDYLPPPPKVELSVYKKLRRQRYLKAEQQDTEDDNPDEEDFTRK